MPGRLVCRLATCRRSIVVLRRRSEDRHTTVQAVAENIVGRQRHEHVIVQGIDRD